MELIPVQLAKNLVNSMEKRVTALINAGGGFFYTL